jgi:hypothetical protein
MVRIVKLPVVGNEITPLLPYVHGAGKKGQYTYYKIDLKYEERIHNKVLYGVILSVVSAVVFPLAFLAAVFSPDYCNLWNKLFDKEVVKVKKDLSVEEVFQSTIQGGISWEAEALSKGNKAANLLRLESIIQTHGITQCSVPKFQGIKHDEIVSLLRTSGAWVQITQSWQGFQGELAKNQGLTQEAQEHLQAIRNIINQQNFTTANICQNAERKEELQRFLQDAETNKQLLMVRSTGREDGKDLSNAGGNASVSSVTPLDDQLDLPIKEVLSSYFSEKSILQRIIGNDARLQSDLPFMPVLLQVMIGECSGLTPDEIPLSGVMYSTEGEGNTQGVTAIQATRGHNEAVVNGLAAVDEYYINAQSSIYPVVRNKPTRLKTENGKLVSVPNEVSTQNKSTLTKKQLLKLKRLAILLEREYGYPVDVEFVIQGEMLYLVQARPIEKKALEPSFISKEVFNQAADKEKIQATMIGVGSATTRLIQDPSEVIIADNVRQALDEYLKRVAQDPAAQDKIQAIIVKEMAPSTSHEASIFRRQKKAVFCIEDTQPIKAHLENNKKMYADPQRSCIFCKELEEEGLLEQGWFSHPIAQNISILPEFFGANAPIPSLEQKVKISLQELMRLLKEEEDITKARIAADLLLNKVYFAIQREVKQENSAINTYIKQHLEGLYRQLYIVIEDHKKMLADPTAQPIDRLYSVNFIEALFLQVPHTTTVAGLSLGALLKTEAQEKGLFKELDIQQSARTEYLVQCAKVGEYALVPEIRAHWMSFVKNGLNRASVEDLKSFSTLIHTLASLDALPLWFNTSFVKVIDEENQLSPLLQEFKDAERFLTQLKSIDSAFKAFSITGFDNPLAWEQQWQLFTDLVDTNIAVLLTGIDQTNPLGKQMAAAVLKNIIDTFDASIKALTGSSNYTDMAKKTAYFESMTTKYGELFEKLSAISFLQQDLEALCPPARNDSTIATYIEGVKELFSFIDPTKDQFVPSDTFNVAGATLGSKADFNRSIGKPPRGDFLDKDPRPTLENIFSLIHQNLLVITSAINKQEEIQEQVLPKEFAALQKQFRESLKYEMNGKFFIPFLTGVEWTKEHIRYSYNLTMGNHSCTFEIFYSTSTQKCSIQSFFIGNDWSRWSRIAIAVKAIAKYLAIPLTKERLDSKQGIVTFKMEVDKGSIEVLSKILGHFVISTFTAASYFKTDDKTFWDNIYQTLKEHASIHSKGSSFLESFYHVLSSFSNRDFTLLKIRLIHYWMDISDNFEDLQHAATLLEECFSIDPIRVYTSIYPTLIEKLSSFNTEPSRALIDNIKAKITQMHLKDLPEANEKEHGRDFGGPFATLQALLAFNHFSVEEGIDIAYRFIQERVQNQLKLPSHEDFFLYLLNIDKASISPNSYNKLIKLLTYCLDNGLSLDNGFPCNLTLIGAVVDAYEQCQLGEPASMYFLRYLEMSMSNLSPDEKKRVITLMKSKKFQLGLKFPYQKATASKYIAELESVISP